MPLEAPVTMAVGILVICVTHVKVSVVVRLVLVSYGNLGAKYNYRTARYLLSRFPSGNLRLL